MNTQSGGWIIAAAAIFVLDVFIPLGIAVPMLYVIPVLLTRLVPGPRITVVIATCSVALTLLGIVVSPGEFVPAVAAERALASALQLVVAGLLLIHKQSLQRLSAAQPAGNEGKARLRASDERLRHVLEKTQTAVWDWDVLSGKVFWTPQHFTMLGYKPDSVEPSYANWAARGHPEDLPSTEAAVREAMAQHRDYRHQFRVLWPDGTVRWINAHGQYTYGPDGHCTRMVGLMLDITDRKQIEIMVQQSEQRHRGLLEAMSVITWACLPSGLHVEPQPAWMAFTGQTVDEMLGVGWTKVVHPDDLAGVAQRWNGAVTKGQPFFSEHRIRRHDG